jgi:hypothetical protein
MPQRKTTKPASALRKAAQEPVGLAGDAAIEAGLEPSSDRPGETAVNNPAEAVDPPIEDEPELTLEEKIALANAAMPVVAAAPATLDEASLQAEIDAEIAERERLEAEAAALSRAEEEPETVAPEPAEVRVMVLKAAQEGVFQATLNGKSYPLQRGIAKRMPRELLAVLEDSDVTFEIVG